VEERSDRLTLLRGAVEDEQVKVVRFTEIISENYLFFEVEHGDPCSVKSHPRLVLLRLELVKNRRCHYSGRER
jgi:hypothetical protein